MGSGDLVHLNVDPMQPRRAEGREEGRKCFRPFTAFGPNSAFYCQGHGCAENSGSGPELVTPDPVTCRQAAPEKSHHPLRWPSPHSQGGQGDRSSGTKSPLASEATWGELDSNDTESVLSCSVTSSSSSPHGLWPARFLSSWNSLGKNTGVGSHSLLQGIFLTQGSNQGLLRSLPPEPPGMLNNNHQHSLYAYRPPTVL